MKSIPLIKTSIPGFLLLMIQCTPIRKVHSYTQAESNAIKNGYSDAIKTQEKGQLEHLCLYPTWYGENRKLTCPECFERLDSNLIKIGIIPIKKGIDRDDNNYGYEALYWIAYKQAMDSLIGTEHGTNFLDSICLSPNKK